MPIVLIVLVAGFSLPGLYVGVRSVRRWDERHDPEYFRDVVQQGVMAFLKVGVLLLLLTAAAIAVVGALAARRGGTPIPGGVWVCAGAAIVISVGLLLAHVRFVRAGRG